MVRTRRPIPAARLKLLIFDLDGTLIDSQQDLCNSINAMLRHFQRPELPCEVISTYIGDGAPMLVRRALGDPDEEHFVQSALQFFLDHYREHKLDTTYAYDGVREMLDAVRGDAAGGRKLAVLTNKPLIPSQRILEALGLAGYFMRVYGGNSFHTKKPDPLGVETLLREAQVSAEQAVLIGDSDVDVLTGRNSGVWTCGVTYGFAPHTLETSHPDVLVDTPQELAEVLRA